jgi:DNA-binding winged helix-turn-helix (wHTH) protein
MSEPGTARRIFRFGVFEMDLGQRELRRNGLKVKLQDQPFQLLMVLLERPGELVTREQLRGRLWPADTFVDFDHSLNAAIRRVRDALGDDPDNPHFIETVPRHGYRFLAEVSEPGSGLPKIASPSHSLPRRAILILLALLAVLGFGAMHYMIRRPSSSLFMRTVPLTTSKGAEGQPAFSRDGEQVAFIWDGDTAKGTDVYLKRIGTDRPLQLTQSNEY